MDRRRACLSPYTLAVCHHLQCSVWCPSSCQTAALLKQRISCPRPRPEKVSCKAWLISQEAQEARFTSVLNSPTRFWPCLQWGNCVLGITDVWDERNGLLWAEPFEKVYLETFCKAACENLNSLSSQAMLECRRTMLMR